MVLAEKLAHLVRRTAGLSGVGRVAASALARARRHADRIGRHTNRLRPYLAPVEPVVARIRPYAPVIGAFAFCLAVLCAGFAVGLGGPAVAPLDAAARAHAGHAPTRLAESRGNAALRLLGVDATLGLARATSPPHAAPAALADQPPLAAREDFAFAPYWTLPQSGTFSITGLSTLAYFSLDVNPNGTLDESGPGWNGYQSQDLADLITRAHGAGERVVLTVTDFAQGSLDSLTSSPTAPATLSSALVPLLQSKSLDGVNFDLEGTGSADRAGLTRLISSVAGSLRAVNPHWQITMDTYASSAGDSGSFYDIPALALAVDAFFVMDYELNLAGSSTAASPLTSGQFSTQTTLAQYTAAVPASKVILGVPFFGIDWPTDNGTVAATATGGAVDIPDSQAEGNGPPYWDPVTDTAWTSYEVGGQWHESYYEGENGLYDLSLMASRDGVRGVGIWALGMESDDARMIATLDGISPGPPPGTGPQATSASTPLMAAPGPPGRGAANAGVAGSAGSAAPAAPSPATTPTSGAAVGPADGGSGGVPVTAPVTPTTTAPGPFVTGVYGGATVALTPVPSSQVLGVVPAGTLTDFQTNESPYACLDGVTLNVYDNVNGKAVAEAVTPTDCIAQDFQLP